jgi:hypothetical protein
MPASTNRGGDVPVYPWGQAPPELLTRAQLAVRGLRPGTTKPVAVLVWGPRRRPRTAQLFDVAISSPKRAATSAQLAALARANAARRTCPECRRDVGYVLTYWRGLICADCTAAAERVRVGHARRGATRTARRWLTGDTVILDVETTDLYGWAVDITVVAVDGQVLLDTLVNAQAPIHSDAAAVHGITAAEQLTAPVFAELVDQLAGLLHGRTVVAYNADHDQAVLHAELERYFSDWDRVGQPGWRTPPPADAWMAATSWGCAMRAWAQWCGEWSDYWGDWLWSPLPGASHRALGDCQATLALLHTMADSLD